MLRLPSLKTGADTPAFGPLTSSIPALWGRQIPPRQLRFTSVTMGDLLLLLLLLFLKMVAQRIESVEPVRAAQSILGD